MKMFPVFLLFCSVVFADLEFQNVCDDFKEIQLDPNFFPENSEFYYRSLKKFKKLKVFSSENMWNNWNLISNLPIQGLGDTLNGFHLFLEEHDCLFLPWGGSVRDLVLGRPVADVDGQITCDPKDLKLFCEEKYGSDNCHHHHRGSYKLIVGNLNVKAETPFVEPLDLAHWNTTFEVKKAQFEYSANALAYFPAKNLLFDVSGTALKDICGKVIRIPAQPTFWDEWSDENSMNKLLRYWTLRSKGFKPFGPKIRSFIISKLEKHFVEKKALSFACHKFFDGKTDLQNHCLVFDSVDVEQQKQKLENFIDLVLEDFAFSEFSQKLKTLFENMIIFKSGDE